MVKPQCRWGSVTENIADQITLYTSIYFLVVTCSATPPKMLIYIWVVNQDQQYRGKWQSQKLNAFLVNMS